MKSHLDAYAAKNPILQIADTSEMQAPQIDFYFKPLQHLKPKDKSHY